MRTKFIFHMDPGHGWLEVTKIEALELDIVEKISPYSYEDRKNFYLEEDCDAALFIDAYVAKYGTKPEFVYRNHEDGFPLAR